MKKVLRELQSAAYRKGYDMLQSYGLLLGLSSCEALKKGDRVPLPRVVTIDPINSCNLRCTWCNARYVIDHETSMLSKKTLLSIVDFLNEWEDGIEAVALSGGGEPLMHPDIGSVIERCALHEMLIALSTNGVKIDEFFEPLSLCHWIGASIDAGSGMLMKELKSFDYFDRITESIRSLLAYSRKHNAPLTRKPMGFGVLYRYLVHPGNVHEIYQAAAVAKRIGCENFYFRPASVPWDLLKNEDREGSGFDREVMSRFNAEIARAKTLEDGTFRVLGTTRHEARGVARCYGLFSTAIFMPALSGNEEDFDIGLCYDRRGDSSLSLGQNLRSPFEMRDLWGSEKHWKIFEGLDTATCPYCV
jgi:pyruvate-formate lyase-activating enzyme